MSGIAVNAFHNLPVSGLSYSADWGITAFPFRGWVFWKILESIYSFRCLIRHHPPAIAASSLAVGLNTQA